MRRRATSKKGEESNGCGGQTETATRVDLRLSKAAKQTMKTMKIIPTHCFGDYLCTQ